MNCIYIVQIYFFALLYLWEASEVKSVVKGYWYYCKISFPCRFLITLGAILSARYHIFCNRENKKNFFVNYLDRVPELLCETEHSKINKHPKNKPMFKIFSLAHKESSRNLQNLLSRLILLYSACSVLKFAS